MRVQVAVSRTARDQRRCITMVSGVGFPHTFWGRRTPDPAIQALAQPTRRRIFILPATIIVERAALK